ncbi:MAG: DNA-binding protein [Betaproteobacteria bacterium RIFCSPLOWO2_02_FULL_63_19]|nr:MAG: DNA-binding protein [Betaproteobacteria bacterium RIFCSPLOWO2_02_FULL_63_19]
MSLQNLVGRSLEAVAPDHESIGRLLAAAERNLADAQLAGLSAENRFDAAYKAIMQCAMAALQANGYRTLTSRPGHHQTALQTLPLTIGLPKERMIVLDALRKQRNLADYEGDSVPKQTALECFGQARQVLADVKAWLATQKPTSA